MTREEAIEILKHHKPNDFDNAYEVGEAIVMAIKALSAIGDIKAEIEFERDRKLGGQFFEAVQYKSFNKCLKIIDKHIGGDTE